jgi:hypothetical protein
MSFASDLAQFAAKTEQRARAVHQGAALMVQESIVEGSAVTGAPPLPIAHGNFQYAGFLRNSVTLTYPDADTAIIATPAYFAKDVEDNPRGVRYEEGGAHGWKLTIAAFGRIVGVVARRIAGYG